MFTIGFAFLRGKNIMPALPMAMVMAKNPVAMAIKFVVTKYVKKQKLTRKKLLYEKGCYNTLI
ncbi:MAG: hypothetical protein RRY40_00920 [Oscillospiraceae bacterium]